MVDNLVDVCCVRNKCTTSTHEINQGSKMGSITYISLYVIEKKQGIWYLQGQ